MLNRIIKSQNHTAMTNSQKILKKIMLYSLIPGVILGAIGLIFFWTLGNGVISSVCGVLAGVCGFILALTFIAFLISLVVASAKGD